MRTIVSFLLPALLVGCAGTPRERAAIATKDAPAAIGPYSQAIRAGDLLYLSGQIPLDPATGKMVEGGIEAQTHRVMRNLKAVLETAGFSMAEVVQCQIFLTDMSHYAAVNGVYATYFGGAPPARAVVQVARLPRDAPVEIMMTAMRARPSAR
jgi:2-iminobutanoate/2-iminopropanoate deaminase